MSSGQPNNKVETKQLTSITRKLHWLGIRKKLGLFVLFDLGIFVLLSLAVVADREFNEFGYFLSNGYRLISHIDNKEALIYKVIDKDTGLVLYSTDVYPAFIVIASIVIFFVMCQVLNLLLSSFKEWARIKKILQPINEMAISIGKMAGLEYNDDKYQLIENAIDTLKPEANEKLSFGDKDLEGIELAVNNLMERVRESNRQQARFVNDASHELRTPIAVIEGYANMLKRWGTEDASVLEESINAISTETEHMKHLVEQLLFLARGDSGRTVIEKVEIDITGLMNEIYEESLMIDENHVYRYKCPENEIQINADSGLLKQAVRILVDNAAKYTNKGDEIILSAGVTEEGQPYLQVQDTGIGMAENDVAHMFERFYRSDDVRSFAGTGLGLSIAKWIVDKHGGHFEILSRPEIGTRIRIVL